MNESMKSSLLLAVLGLTALGSVARAQTTVSVVATDANAAETASGVAPNPANIRVSRTGSTTSALTVWVRVSGAAVQGVDYRFPNPIGSIVIIPAGSSSLDIPITVLDDYLIEGAEDLRIKLEDKTGSGAPVPYLIDNHDDRADVTIADDEDPNLPPRAIVSVLALDAQGAETPAGANPVVFRLTRENNLTVALDVRYTLGGTAVAGSDYLAPPATIAIPAGAAFVDVPIVPIDDTLVEGPETVTFTLLPHPSNAVPPPPEAYVLGASITATATILSEDLPPPPTVTINSPTNGTALTALAASPISIPITFTAVDGDGYITSCTVFDGARVLISSAIPYPTPPAPGTPFNGSFTLTNAYGGTHLLRVRVTDNSGVSSVSPLVSVVVTYIYPIMSVSAVDGEAAEVAAGETPNPAVFAVTVDTPMPTDQYVVYRLTTPGPGVDFDPPAGYSFTNFWPINITSGPRDYGIVRFPAGTTRVEVVVTPTDDLLLEGPETLTFTLSYPVLIDEWTFEGIVQFTEGGVHRDPNALPVRNFAYDLSTNNRTAAAIILDNDTVPAPFSIVTLTVTDADAEETPPGFAPNPGAFTITRGGPTNLPLTVNYAVTSPPRPIPLTSAFVLAQNGVDYAALSGVATIPAGAASVDVVIAPVYDLLAEVSEIVHLTLRPSAIPLPDPSSYMLGDATTASLLIRDANVPAGTPVVWITANDSQAYEDNVFSRTASFVVERNRGLTNSLTVLYSIGGTASNGVDYADLPGFVTMPAGSPRVLILVDPIADGVTEPAETVGLTLQPPPLDVFPPPYLLGSSSLMPRSAGVTIRDQRIFPPNRYTRLLERLRNQHVIVPLPVPVPTPPAPATTNTWAIEASANLIDWEEIGTAESSAEANEFVDVNAGDSPSRFYRFRAVSSPAP